MNVIEFILKKVGKKTYLLLAGNVILAEESFMCDEDAFHWGNAFISSWDRCRMVTDFSSVDEED